MVVVVVVVLVAWCLVVVVAGDVRGHRVSWPVGWIAWGAPPIPCGCESVIRPISRFAAKRSDMGPALNLKFRILEIPIPFWKFRKMVGLLFIC